MKKIITFILLTLLLISVKTVYAEEINTPSNDRSIINRNNIVINEELFITLLNAGYSVDEVYNMTEEELQNANLTPQGVIATKYIKTTTITRYGITTSFSEEVSEFEYENAPNGPIESLNAMGEVNTTYKMLRSILTDYSTLYKKYRTYLYWKQMPSKRSYDIIGNGYEASYVKYASNVHFSQLYTQNYVTYTESIYTQKRTTSGAGATFELPSGTITTLCQDMDILVEKANSNQTITALTATGDYAHATSTVSESQAQNYTINYVNGLVLDSSIYNKYDSMTAAFAYWTGTW